MRQPSRCSDLVGSPRAVFCLRALRDSRRLWYPSLWELSLPPSKGSGVFPQREAASQLPKHGLGFAVIQAPQMPICSWQRASCTRGKLSEPKPHPSSQRLLGQIRGLVHRQRCVLLRRTRAYPCRPAGRRRRARSPH